LQNAFGGEPNGKEKEETPRMDFKRTPRAEINGAEEDEGISNCEEDAQNRRRYTPKGIWRSGLVPGDG
jgi:hypothetical protein